MTSATKKRIVPAKVKGAAAKTVVVRRATTAIRPKVKINFKRAVRG
jgi:hypothetical protein